MKTTYSMGVIDWSSDVCSSDLGVVVVAAGVGGAVLGVGGEEQPEHRGGGGCVLSLAGQHLVVAQSGRRGAGEARLQARMRVALATRVSVRVDTVGRSNVKNNNSLNIQYILPL